MYGALLITCSCGDDECARVDLEPPKGYIEDPYDRAKALLMAYYARNGLPVPPPYKLHIETRDTMWDRVKIQSLRNERAWRDASRDAERLRRRAHAAAREQRSHAVADTAALESPLDALAAAATEAAPIVRRPRGRPPKSQPSQGVVAAPTAKRPVGRPRKHAFATQLAHMHELVSSLDGLVKEAARTLQTLQGPE